MSLTICPNMNRFLDLLDTDIKLDVVVTVESDQLNNVSITVNNKTVDINLEKSTSKRFQLCILDSIDIFIPRSVSVIDLDIDGHKIWPRFGWSDQQGHYVKIDRPFYQWLHTISGQGWLLIP